jgi:hypothetical protein
MENYIGIPPTYATPSKPINEFFDGDYSDFVKNKDKKWYKFHADRYISTFTAKNDKDVAVNRQAYLGKVNKNDLRYITDRFGMTMPVPDIPSIPLIKRYVDLLDGMNKIRPFSYAVNYSDDDAIEAKQLAKAKELNIRVMSKILDPNNAEQSKNVVEKEVESLRGFRTEQEIAAYKMLDDAVNRLELREKTQEMFKERMITGSEYYGVRVREEGQPPEIEIVLEEDIVFSADDVKYLDQSQFCVRRKYISLTEAYTRYGHLMTKEDRDNLKLYYSLYGTNTRPMFSDEGGDNELGERIVNFLQEYEVQFKVNVEVEEDYEDGVLHAKDKKKTTKRYYQQLHTVTRLGSNIYLKYGVVKYAMRDTEDISRVLLSYNGIRTNHSLVGLTRDLQSRYVILWFKEMEAVVLSGNKGIYLIEEFLPTDMKTDEWLAWRRQGIARLSVSREGEDIPGQLIGQLGQTLKEYDDSLPAQGIQAMMSIMQQIETTIGDICGVTKQMLGQYQQYDTKSNMENSITQGSIVAEALFKEHDRLVKRMLNSVVNVMRVSMISAESNTSLTPQQKKLANMSADENDWSLYAYNVMIVDSFKEQKALAQLQQLVMQQAQAQMIDIDKAIQAATSKSVSEAVDIIKTAADEMRKAQSQGAQAKQQAEQQAAQAEAEMQKVELEMKKAAAVLNKAKTEADIAAKQKELEIKEELAAIEREFADISRSELEYKKSNKDADNMNDRRTAAREKRN